MKIDSITAGKKVTAVLDPSKKMVQSLFVHEGETANSHHGFGIFQNYVSATGTINILCSDRYTDLGDGATYQSTFLDIAAW